LNNNNKRAAAVVVVHNILLWGEDRALECLVAPEEGCAVAENAVVADSIFLWIFQRKLDCRPAKKGEGMSNWSGFLGGGHGRKYLWEFANAKWEDAEGNGWKPIDGRID
jgi:hypothetical protein